MHRARQCDTIQARDLYQPAGEFQCKANIVLCFNEVPGFDDASGGMERRLDMINYPFKFVDNPQLAHEKKIDTKLAGILSSKECGACFLAILIKRFNERWFAFETPEVVKIASKEFANENDVIGQFLEARFVRTSNSNDKIKLTDMFTIWKKSDYASQLKATRVCDLSQKLKAKGFTDLMYSLGGALYIRCFRIKDEGYDNDEFDES